MEIFKNIIPDIITRVWLTGVGSTIGGPLQTILNKGIIPCVVSYNF